MGVDMKKYLKSKVKSKSGQALIEFILFVPFMMTLYSSILTLASSINGSINQQKHLRGYFYARVKHNSTVPVPFNIEFLNGIVNVGMVQLGWREKEQNNSAVAPCYRIKSFLGNALNEECEEQSGDSTLLIRVKTVYGICGTNYVINDAGGGEISFSNNSANAQACMNIGG
jgi:hypothetical protein